jgi:tetratricopeptide (TPR) repeat protein
MRLLLTVALVAGLAACREGPPPSPVAPADIQSALNACIRGDQRGGQTPENLREMTPPERAALDGIATGIARLDSLLALAPGHGDALATRGLCRAVRFAADSVQADARAAFADLTAAIDTISAAPDAFETPLGTLYNQRAFVVQSMRPGDWPATLADLGRAVEAEPRNSAYVFDRGLAFAMAGDTARARADLRRFLDLAPDDAERAEALRAALARPPADPPGR